MVAAKQGDLVSPWEWSTGDNTSRQLKISVDFNVSTFAVTAVTTTRDVGCHYGRLLIGTGVDGHPDSTTKVFIVQEGVNQIPLGQWNAKVGSTIQEFLAQQITAGT